MVEAVAGVYNSLPPEQCAQTAILAGNYGEPVPSTSSAHAMDSPRQSARIKITTTGGRGSTPERASSDWSGTSKTHCIDAAESTKGLPSLPTVQ